jgi:hypothetical protein
MNHDQKKLNFQKKKKKVFGNTQENVQCEVWGFHSVAEDSSLLRCDAVSGWVVPSVFNERSAFKMPQST